MSDYYWKDWAGPIIGGAFAIGVAIVTMSEKLWSGRMARTEAQDKERRERAYNYDVAQTQDLTARFRALLDGYEARIRDLSAELGITMAEVRDKRMEIARLETEIVRLETEINRLRGVIEGMKEIHAP